MNQRVLYFTLTLLLCVASAVHAKVGIVKTREGNTYEGDINDTDAKSVTVTMRGIPTTIERGRIISITYPQQNFAQQFAARKARLAPNDAQGRLALAREAFAQREYALARDAVDESLQIDPNNADAVALRDTIQSQMRLEHAKPKTDEPAVAKEAAPATQPTDQKMLTPVQINAVRQAEMREDDVGVRIRLERGVLKRFIEYSQIPPGEVISLNIMQQAQLILKKGTPEMRKDVMILNDPPALFQYRRTVQPFVVQNCATSMCHGGNAATNWNMVLPPDSDAATYTNFLNMEKYTKRSKQSNDALFGAGDPKMIDRQQPRMSLLLQYALPGAISEIDHVELPNYHPPLRGLNDPRYLMLLDWIGKGLQPVEPDYGFDWGAPAATQPVSQAASAPATKPAANIRPPTVAPHSAPPSAAPPRR